MYMWTKKKLWGDFKEKLIWENIRNVIRFFCQTFLFL